MGPYVDPYIVSWVTFLPLATALRLLATGVLGTISPQLNRWIHLGWFFLGEKLGFVVSKVVLGAVFFAVLLPMGLLARVFRKDQMKLRSPGNDGYHKRDHSYTAADLENMW